MNPLAFLGGGVVGGLLGLGVCLLVEAFNDEQMAQTRDDARARLAALRAQQYEELRALYERDRARMSRKTRREFKRALGHGPDDMDPSFFDRFFGQA